jgi:hypothetical protein
MRLHSPVTHWGSMSEPQPTKSRNWFRKSSTCERDQIVHQGVLRNRLYQVHHEGREQLHTKVDDCELI